MAEVRSNLFIICLLGALSVVSPFAIDMYLPAFAQVGADLGVSSGRIPLTLSSYFIGLAFGQVFYGPVLDRFGRKRPLYAGLVVFILASIGCAHAASLGMLVALRLLQGLGGCGAQVAATAMVRDFFPVKDSARVFSLLFLFIAVSPLLAPSFGGWLVAWIGWRAVFFILAGIVGVIFALVFFLLPEGHTPDPTISLKPAPIIKEYMLILGHAKFTTYALAGAFAFAGLFTYVAGAPIIFMEVFHMSARAFSSIFAVLACGFIGGSQVNVLLLRRFSSETLFFRVLMLQVATGLVFLLGAWMGWLGLYSTLALFFVFLACTGLTYPNAAALALAPFSKYAGSAAALLGSLQLGCGALISTGIGLLKPHDNLPIIGILALTTLLGFGIFLAGRERALAHTEML